MTVRMNMRFQIARFYRLYCCIGKACRDVQSRIDTINESNQHKDDERHTKSTNLIAVSSYSLDLDIITCTLISKISATS